MSHGIPRVSNPQARSEEAYKKEQQQIADYRKLDAEIKSQIESGSQNYTQSTLDLTSKLLRENPEYATRWNDRRRILQRLFEGLEEGALHDLIRTELDFLFSLLVKFPKCYAIWNHRIWLLHQASQKLPQERARSTWQDELVLVGKMHARDPRNFHGWDYRRLVVRNLQAFPAADEQPKQALCEVEFDYTTTMIRKNLSNFSAWHNRSVFIPQVLTHRAADDVGRRALFDSELAFIKDALFLDPNDQSLWFYHHYLMSVLMAPPAEVWVNFTNHDREQVLQNEITEIRELLEDESCTDCKWIYQYLLQYTSDYLKLDAGTRLVSTQEMRDWFLALRRLDPLRSGRWKDWEKQLGLS